MLQRRTRCRPPVVRCRRRRPLASFPAAGRPHLRGFSAVIRPVGRCCCRGDDAEGEEDGEGAASKNIALPGRLWRGGGLNYARPWRMEPRARAGGRWGAGRRRRRGVHVGGTRCEQPGAGCATQTERLGAHKWQQTVRAPGTVLFDAGVSRLAPGCWRPFKECSKRIKTLGWASSSAGAPRAAPAPLTAHLGEQYRRRRRPRHCTGRLLVHSTGHTPCITVLQMEMAHPGPPVGAQRSRCQLKQAWRGCRPGGVRTGVGGQLDAMLPARLAATKYSARNQLRFERTLTSGNMQVRKQGRTLVSHRPRRPWSASGLLAAAMLASLIDLHRVL